MNNAAALVRTIIVGLIVIAALLLAAGCGETAPEPTPRPTRAPSDQSAASGQGAPTLGLGRTVTPTPQPTPAPSRQSAAPNQGLPLPGLGRTVTPTPRLVPTAAPAIPIAPAPAGGRIAFQSDRDGNAEIYAMNADGSGLNRLTHNSASDWLPEWSPDGGRIAFTSNRDGNNEIYAMNADGSGQTRLTVNGANDEDPTWSPDGRRIAFRSDRDGNAEIYAMNADGSGLNRLTVNGAWDWWPAWSPDGGRIAFTSDRDGNNEIYVMNSDGSDATRLTDNSTDDYFPSWSPDGQRIAFHSYRDGDNEIYVMNSDGSGEVQLTDNSANDAVPSWSSDGRRIAFYSTRGGNRDIYAMTANGSGQTRLTYNNADDWDPAWSPGGFAPVSAPAPAIRVTPTPVRDDHGDGISSATRMGVGDTVNGDIETSDDVDYFSFRAEADWRYTIQTALRTNDDTEIALYAQNGSRLAENDDDDTSYASRIDWTAPLSGTYYVAVFGHGGDTGTYRLRTTGEAPAAPAMIACKVGMVIGSGGVCDDMGVAIGVNDNDNATINGNVAGQPIDAAFTSDIDIGNLRIVRQGAVWWRIDSLPSNPIPDDDHGDGISSATLMRVGDTVNGDIETSDDVDYFSFRAEADWSYTIETALGTNDDTQIALYDQNGSRLAANDDYGGYASRIEWSAPASGTYYVAVFGHGGDIGTYRLTVTDDAPLAPVSGRIAFASDRDGNYDIYLMNADGTGLTRLTDNDADDWHPAWSPDGQRIAFASERDGNYDIYLLDERGRHGADAADRQRRG